MQVLTPVETTIISGGLKTGYRFIIIDFPFPLPGPLPAPILPVA